MICESCTRGSPRLHQRQCVTLFVEESLFCVFLLSRFVSLDDTHNYYILFLFSLCSPEFGGYSSSSFLQTPPTCLHNNRISKRLKVKDFNSCYRYATYSHHLCAILSAGLFFSRFSNGSCKFVITSCWASLLIVLSVRVANQVSALGLTLFSI